jgi:hypothetical protein
MKWKLLLLGLLLAAPCLPVDAQKPSAIRDTLEARMLVTGSVDIEPDGSVSAIALDHLDQIPVPVVDLVERAAARWRFEPILVNGVTVPVRAPMSLKVLANKVPGAQGEFTLRLDGAYFGQDDAEAGEIATSVKRHPPEYPKDLLYRGISGTVYLVLKIGRDGAVQDVVAEQVNLNFVGDARQMERWRKMLAVSALAAARKWIFASPGEGDDVDAPFWSVRLPVDYRLVDFRLGDDPRSRAGKWEVYVPGPRQEVEWLTEAESSTQPDALAADRVHPVDPGRRLLTALDPGT